METYGLGFVRCSALRFLTRIRYIFALLIRQIPLKEGSNKIPHSSRVSRGREGWLRKNKACSLARRDVHSFQGVP